jgi:hypothetical protein
MMNSRMVASVAVRVGRHTRATSRRADSEIHAFDDIMAPGGARQGGRAGSNNDRGAEGGEWRERVDDMYQCSENVVR